MYGQAPRIGNGIATGAQHQIVTAQRRQTLREICQAQGAGRAESDRRDASAAKLAVADDEWQTAAFKCIADDCFEHAGRKRGGRIEHAELIVGSVKPEHGLAG